MPWAYWIYRPLQSSLYVLPMLILKFGPFPWGLAKYLLWKKTVFPRPSDVKRFIDLGLSYSKSLHQPWSRLTVTELLQNCFCNCQWYLRFEECHLKSFRTIFAFCTSTKKYILYTKETKNDRENVGFTVGSFSLKLN